MESPGSILVVKPSSMGDVVHTLPAVACLRKQWPEAKITWMVNPEWAPLLEGNPNIDEILEFPRGKFRGVVGPLRALPWLEKIKATVNADLVLDFQGLFRSGVISKRCSAGKVWGLSDAREGARFFYDHIVEVPPRDAPMHAVDRYLTLVRALGCHVELPLDWTLPEGSAPVGFNETDLFVVLHPFSRGEGKSLGVEEVAAFAKALDPLQVVLVGKFEGAIEHFSHVQNLLNKTSLAELCWLLRRACFVASVDSGPMHLAAALSKRLLGIHTWSDPRLVGPYRADAWIWKDNKLGRYAQFPKGDGCPRDLLPFDFARIVQDPA